MNMHQRKKGGDHVGGDACVTSTINVKWGILSGSFGGKFPPPKSKSRLTRLETKKKGDILNLAVILGFK